MAGPHRAQCGDATNPASYRALLGNRRVQLIWSDPPYGVNCANSAKDKLRGTHCPILNDEGLAPN